MVPQLGLTFEFSILDEESNFQPQAEGGLRKNSSYKLKEPNAKEEKNTAVICNSADIQSPEIGPISLRITPLEPPQKGVFSNRLIFDQVDPVGNCEFLPLKDIPEECTTDAGPDIPESLSEMIRMIHSLDPEMANNLQLPTQTEVHPDTNIQTHTQSQTDLKDKYSSHKLSNYTSNNFSRQESNINDYLIDDDGEEDFDPNDDDVSELESIDKHQEGKNSHSSSDGDPEQSEGEKTDPAKKDNSNNTQDLIEESEQFEVDDQTYFEDFSAIDSIAVENDRASKIKSYIVNEGGQDTHSRADASFDISIGNKKIEVPVAEITERKYFDEYIEGKEDEDADQSSMMYNSFMSGE